MEKYEFLLKKISKKIKDPKHKKYIEKNLKSIALDLKDFSKFFSKVVNISMENLPVANKIKQLNKIKFRSSRLTKKESNDILDALNLKNITGGGTKDKEIAALKEIHKSLDKNVMFCLTNIGVIASKIFTNFPKYSLLIVSKIFSDIANLYNFDWHSFEDFTKKMDWVFLYLFVLASLPVVGVFFDIIIIIRAVKQDRIFLALLTFVTTMVSLLAFHIVDLGLIIKLLYFLDVTSYTAVQNSDIPKLTEGSKEVFFNNDGRTTEIPTTKEGLKDIEKLYNKVEQATKGDSATTEDKEKNLENIKNKLNQTGGSYEDITSIDLSEEMVDELESIDSNMSL
tara:strand:+ start:1331 stop:2347 length:1017 start_codon:yes stop_codon:yes gene_type:complete